MTWSRRFSNTEELMVLILRRSKRALTLPDIVKEIQKIQPHALNGQAPIKSLYSIVYRREKRRKEAGEKMLFKTALGRYGILYKLRK